MTRQEYREDRQASKQSKIRKAAIRKTKSPPWPVAGRATDSGTPLSQDRSRHIVKHGKRQSMLIFRNFRDKRLLTGKIEVVEKILGSQRSAHKDNNLYECAR